MELITPGCRMNFILEIKTKALEMVTAFIDSYRIEAIGGTVFKFKPGAEDSGGYLMSTSMAVDCRDYLNTVGIAMERVDSGGSPEWHFRVR